MSFQEHLKGCPQCRGESPAFLCPEGERILRAESNLISPAQIKEAGECAQQGKLLAIELVDIIGPTRPTPVIIHALAYLLAAMMRSHDGELTEHEMAGFGLISDAERLATFCLEVRELLGYMREVEQAPSSNRRVQ